MTNFLSLGSVYTPPSLGVSDAVAKEPHHINSNCLAISTQYELHVGKAEGATDSLSGLCSAHMQK